MKPISIAGILLVILGVLALAYQGFTYTHREKVLDVGPIHATKDTRRLFPFPRYWAAWRWWEGSFCWWPAGKGQRNGSFRFGGTLGTNSDHGGQR
jgi:hypothetical protein